MLRHALALAFLAAFAVECRGSSVGHEELARRIDSARPSWPSYQEDMKAQLGAGPVAEWEGNVQEVQTAPDALRVTFRLQGPWAQRDLAVPILLNDPIGGPRQNTAAERRDDRAVYAFALPKNQPAMPIPWVELKFPGGQRRITLDAQGRWKSS